MKASIILLFFVPTFSFAQNLVANGSFEQYYQCPNNPNEVDSCVGWHDVLNTPDFYDTCSSSPVSIPNNFCGYQYPFDGGAYLGLLTYTYLPENYREIVGSQLIDTMFPGITYHISMRVSRGNWTLQSYNVAASNKLGVRFTTKPYTSSNSPSINNFAQLSEDSILKDTLNWVLLHWNFIADSAYTHLYIGNFFSDNMTDTAVINPPLGHFGYAYYFIDSVNVECEEGCPTGINNIKNSSINIWFDQGTKNIRIEGMYLINKVIIYNTEGQLISNFSDLQKSTILNVSDLTAGMYFILVKSNNQLIIKKIIIT